MAGLVMPSGRGFQATRLARIASSEIRRRAANGEPFGHYVPPAVREYIQRRGLYR